MILCDLREGKLIVSKQHDHTHIPKILVSFTLNLTITLDKVASSQ